MHTFFLRVFVGVLFLSFTSTFLTGPTSTALNNSGRNLTCMSTTGSSYIGPIPPTNQSVFTDADYCLIAIVTIPSSNNLTVTTTYRSAILLWNLYRNIAINQCNFSSTMDIGYGSCTPYYYAMATSLQLCICSTNNCSATYSMCQTSVNQALSSPPPLLPVLQPALTSTISCQNAYLLGNVARNTTSTPYLGCGFPIMWGGADYSKCSTYTANHSTICGATYFAAPGVTYIMAMVEGDYELWMYSIIHAGIYSSRNISGYYQYQTSTSIAAIIPDNTGLNNLVMCLCITNNCNVDLITCTNGMNIPSYLLGYNGSASSTPTASTISPLTSATVSSHSTTPAATTGATSGSSTIIITSSQSSVSTSATTVFTGSSSTVGNISSFSTTMKSSTSSKNIFYL